MFDDHSAWLSFFFFFLSFFAKQMSIRVYFFFDSFSLCCTDVKTMVYKLIKIAIKLILKLKLAIGRCCIQISTWIRT